MQNLNEATDWLVNKLSYCILNPKFKKYKQKILRFHVVGG